MRNSKARRVIIWFTLVVSIISLAVYLYAVVTRHADPLWNRALITYAGVFWLFLAFDEIGRKTAEISNARKAAPRPRPTPQPDMPLPGTPERRTGSSAETNGVYGGDGHRTATGSLDFSEGIRLERIDQSAAVLAEEMVNRCTEEVLALEGKVPEARANAEVADSAETDVVAWLRDESVYPFVVIAGAVGDVDTVGVATIAISEGVYEMKSMYIRPEYRRQGFGREAVKRIEEFTKLLGKSNALRVAISRNNMRAITFFRSVGMKEVPHDQSADNHWVTLEKLL